MELFNPQLIWQDKQAYLNFVKLRERPSVAGLPFLGYLNDREAYRLPYGINYNEKTLAILESLAVGLGGKLEMGYYPKISLLESGEDILEIIDWQEIHFVLILSSYKNKTILIQSVLEAIVLGHLY